MINVGYTYVVSLVMHFFGLGESLFQSHVLERKEKSIEGACSDKFCVLLSNKIFIRRSPYFFHHLCTILGTTDIGFERWVNKSSDFTTTNTLISSEHNIFGPEILQG